MNMKYNHNNVELKCLSYTKEDINYPDFEKKYAYSDLLPQSNNLEIKHLIENNDIHIITAIFDYKISLDLIFSLITTIAKDYECYVTNEYHYLNEIQKYLSKKYKGNLLTCESNSSIFFLELNHTLVDPESIFDWYNLWGHGFNAWIIKKDQVYFFKKAISNIASNEEIKVFLTSKFTKIEFGDIHESIRFISFDKNNADDIEYLIQNG